jgi:lipopolysaccharide transport system permease protein
MHYLKEIFASRELLANLTLREIRGKYKRTIFGQLWSLANPLASMLIYTFIFSYIFRLHPDEGDPSGLDVFALWLLCGLLPWTFLSNVINQGLYSLVNNANLIQKVYFTRIVLPLSVVGSAGFNWLFEMGVLVIALSIAGAFVLPFLPFVILTMAVLAVFGIGIALMLAVANVYFRDTQYFVTILLQLWMYLTPIIYPINLVESQSRATGGLFGTSITLLQVYQLNPMEHFVGVFRALLYDSRIPDLPDILLSLAWAALSLVLGLWIFRANEKKLAEAL